MRSREGAHAPGDLVRLRFDDSEEALWSAAWLGTSRPPGRGPVCKAGGRDVMLVVCSVRNPTSLDVDVEVLVVGRHAAGWIDECFIVGAHA